MTSTPTPAYDIPLTRDDLVLIGEICAIQGQIEYLMQNIVQTLLGARHATLAKMVKSNSLGVKAHIWIDVVRSTAGDPEAIAVSEEALKNFESLTVGRNDFVHAIYAQGHPEESGFGLTTGTAMSDEFKKKLVTMERIVAVGPQNRKIKGAGEIKSVRDDASKMSCALAHIDRILTYRKNGLEPEPTPWRDKFW